MSSLTKRSLLILFAMIVLVAIPMSFAADVDAAGDVAAVDDAADDVIAVDDAVDDVAADDTLEATPIPDNGAFVYIENDNVTIDEGDSFSISGQVAASMGMGKMSKSEMEQMGMTKNGITITCSYEDNDGNPQEYTTTTSNYDFAFDGSTFAGLAGRATPYVMNVVATDDGTLNFDGSGLKSATFNLYVTAPPAPVVGNASDIQALLNCATAGSIVDLTAYDVYDVLDSTIIISTADITIKGNGNTIIKGHGAGNGIFDVAANGVTIQGIKFIDTNPNSLLSYFDDATKNANEVKGWGIRFFGVSDGVVDNCTFIDFNHGVRIQKAANHITVKNSYFTGVTNYLRNDPQVNVEKGTKAIGIMGSQNAVILNNIFDGPMLDAISIASSSGGAQVINNTFIDNSYSIYFGGASTGGTLIKGNKFKNIGYFAGIDNKTGNIVVWDQLPVISIQKSAGGVNIVDNDFEAIANNILIAAEAGNTAHGGLSELGNINVTGNNVVKYTPDVASETVVLLHILARAGELNPIGDINVVNNTFEGEMNSVAFWDTNWVQDPTTWYKKDVDVVIPKGQKPTPVFEINSIADNTIYGVLKDAKGAIIDGQTIFYSVGDANGTTETDEYGLFTIVGEAGKTVVISILNDKVFADATTSVLLPEAVPVPVPINVTVPPAVTELTVNKLTMYAGDSGVLKVTLKSNGTAVANQTVTVSIDGVNKAVLTTDANGTATTTLKYASAATKYAYVTYIDSTGKYLAAQKVSKVTINKKATTITAPAKTFKVKATKKVAITLKSGKTLLSGKKVTITVNGKTFYAKTNSKGVATITVKLTKVGTFKYTAKFAGDGAYKAVSKTTGKIVVKK